MDRLLNTIFIAIFILFAVQNVNSAHFNPQCRPKDQIEVNGTNIDYIFILDHSLEQEKIDKMRYVMKATSCEVPNGSRYRLKTIHVNSGGTLESSGYKTSMDFPETLQQNMVKENVSEAACHRLLKVLDEIGRVKDSARTAYLIMPLDADDSCNLHDLFDASNADSDHHLALINMDGAPESTRSSDLNIKWDKIDLKREDLHKAKVFSQLQESGEIMENIAKWVQKTLHGTLLIRTHYPLHVANPTVETQNKSYSTIPEATTEQQMGVSSAKTTRKRSNEATEPTTSQTNVMNRNSSLEVRDEVNTTMLVVEPTMPSVVDTEVNYTEEPTTTTESVIINVDNSTYSSTTLESVSSTDVTNIDATINTTVTPSLLAVLGLNGTMDNSVNDAENSTEVVTRIDANATVTPTSIYEKENSTVVNVAVSHDVLNSTVVTRIDANTTVSPSSIYEKENSTVVNAAVAHDILNSTVVTTIDANATVSPRSIDEQERSTIVNAAVAYDVLNSTIVTRIAAYTTVPPTRSNVDNITVTITPTIADSNDTVTSINEGYFIRAVGEDFVAVGSNSDLVNAQQQQTEAAETSTETEEAATWYENYYIIGLIFLLLIIIIIIIICLICCIRKKKKGNYRLLEEETQRSPSSKTVAYRQLQDENGYEIVNHEGDMNEEPAKNTAPPPFPAPSVPQMEATQMNPSQETNLASARLPSAPLLVAAAPPAPPAPRAPEGVIDPFNDAPVNQYFVNYKPIEVTPARQQTPTERSKKHNAAVAEPSAVQVKKYDIGEAVDDMF